MLTAFISPKMFYILFIYWLNFSRKQALSKNVVMDFVFCSFYNTHIVTQNPVLYAIPFIVTGSLLPTTYNFILY